MLFLPALKQSGHLARVSLNLVFIGSRKLEEFGESYDAWTSVFAPNIRIFGIDADPAACDRMNAQNQARKINWFERHYPIGIWSSSGAHTLNIAQYAGCSSLLKPRESYMRRHLTHQQMMKVVGQTQVQTTTLDEFCEKERAGFVDYLQIDVQGGGMEVLKGAQKTIETGVLALVSEADFVQAYQGAALFGDVDVHLRQRGFSLFDLVGNHHGTRASFPLNSKEHNGPLEWSDAFYFRDLLDERYENHRFKTPEMIFKLACVADCMNFIDYAAELLEYLTLTHGKHDPKYNFAMDIAQTLERLPQINPAVLAQLPIYPRMNQFLGRTPPAPQQPGIYTINATTGSFGAGGNVAR